MIAPNVKSGVGCRISPDSFVGYSEHGGEIVIGRNVTIRQSCVIRSCTGRVIIGDSITINYGVIIHGYGGVTIGSGTLLSPNVQIYAQNHGITKSKPIRAQKNIGKGIHIGKECWIGAGAIILDGVSIGDGVVVGAGSVVTHSIPPFEIWAGNPAKKIGERQ
jgi:acetyltransferase-like isoleucine patch superfamily enzyme